MNKLNIISILIILVIFSSIAILGLKIKKSNILLDFLIIY